jgi:hypothetical protein
MATRSTIALLRDNGEVVKVYCHWDGYLENNGELLVKHYNTPEKIEALLAHGDISSLGTCVGKKHPFDLFLKDKMSEEDKALAEQAEAEGWTLYYGRDRGETGTEAKVYADLGLYEKNAQFEEFNYCFIYGNWYYTSYDEQVRSVAEELEKLAAKELEAA